MTKFSLELMYGGVSGEWIENPIKRFFGQLEMWPDDLAVIKINEIFAFLNDNRHDYFFHFAVIPYEFSKSWRMNLNNFSIIMTAEVASLVKMFCDTSGFCFEAGELDDYGNFLKK
jgi:hypothetical protein